MLEESSREPREGDSSRLKRNALYVAVLGSFLTPFMISSVNVALPTIGKEFGADHLMLGWIVTSFLLSSSVFLLPFGRLADQYGRKRFFTIGIVVFTIASTILGLANSVPMLIVLRILQGIACAMIFATGTAIITSVFPPGERGQALGISVAAVYMGLSAGPFLGGLLTEHFGWRSIFLFPVPVGIGTVLLVLYGIEREWAEPEAGRFDWVGSVLYGASLVLLIMGVSAQNGAMRIGMIGTGVLLVAVFLGTQMKGTNPILPMGIFLNNRAFTLSSLAAMVHYGATYGISFLMSLFLQNVKGRSPQQAGIILVAQPLMQAFFSPLAGKLSDWFEARLVATSGMVCTMAGLFLLSGMDVETPTGWIVGALAFIGFGFALFSSPNINCVMSSVEKRHYGLASGILSTMRVIGQMCSMGITMFLFAKYLGAATGGPEISPVAIAKFTTCCRIGFRVFGCLCGVGIFFSFARGRSPQVAQPPIPFPGIGAVEDSEEKGET